MTQALIRRAQGTTGIAVLAAGAAGTALASGGDAADAALLAVTGMAAWSWHAMFRLRRELTSARHEIAALQLGQPMAAPALSATLRRELGFHLAAVTGELALAAQPATDHVTRLRHVDAALTHSRDIARCLYDQWDLDLAVDDVLLQSASFTPGDIISHAIRRCAAAPALRATPHVTIADDVPRMLIGDRGRLTRTLAALLDITVRTAPYGQIDISLRRAGDGVAGPPPGAAALSLGGWLPLSFCITCQAGGLAEPGSPRPDATGLQAAQGLVEAMGARLETIASDDRAMCLALHLWQRAGAFTEGAPPLVLVVDEMPARRARLIRVLGELGARVEAVRHGGSACDRCCRGDGYPDMVLCAVHLADMDGAALARALRQLGLPIDVPVIGIGEATDLITEHDGEAALAKVIRMPAQDHRLKKILGEVLEGLAR